MSALSSRLIDFTARCIATRPLTIDLSPAMEERLTLAMIRHNEEDRRLADRDGVAPDHLNVGHCADLAIMCGSMIARGLEDSERDAGLWADFAGRLAPLPRPARMRLHRRAVWSWREARKVWRSL